MRLLLALALCVSTAVFAGEPASQPAGETTSEPAAAPAPAPGDGMKVNPGNSYEGVAPGGSALPPRAPKLPVRRGPERLTWVGFQVKDGTPTVFLELTRAPDYRVETKKNAVVITLKRTVVPLRNNRRPLRVGAFDTSVTDVKAEVHGKDTRIIIHTRKESPEHHERLEPAAGGFQLLLVEVPK